MTEPVILCCAPVTGEGLLLPDNLTGPCDLCGVTVQYRPHAPTPHILRCMPCAVVLMEDGDRIMSTPQMLADARDYFRRKKH